MTMGKRCLSISFCIWVIVFVGMFGLHVSYSYQEEAIVPAIYVFGDSTADVGTNNYLPECEARADVPFNGIDFFHSIPTGRFSNGYNTVDYIAYFLGYKQSPPPFLSVVENNYKQSIDLKRISLLIRGVNFASGGSGLLNTTGKVKWGKVISFGEQVQQFATVSEILGSAAVANLSKSLFLISVGSNDIFEYFVFNNQSNSSTTGQDYVTTLMSTYETHLRGLYKLGAKRFGIVSVPPIGCCPFQRNFSETGGCLEPMNAYAQLFYTGLQDLLQKLSSECKGMMYALADAYQMTNLILFDPPQFGFKEVTKACCGKGKFNAELPCKQDSAVCGDREGYFFWDQFHPTQAASKLAAKILCSGGKQFVAPMNLVQLALLA